MGWAQGSMGTLKRVLSTARLEGKKQKNKNKTTTKSRRAENRVTRLWWPKENLGQALRLTGAALGTFWLITGATLWPPVGWITGLLGLLNNSNSLCQNLASLVSQVVNFVDLLGQRHRLAPGKLYTTAMGKVCNENQRDHTSLRGPHLTPVTPTASGVSDSV